MTAPRRIKIFIDAHAFDKEHQGTRAFIKRLYQSLAAMAPEVQLFFGARDVARLRNELGDLPATYLPYRYSSAPFRLLFDIPRIVKKHGIHFAHFQYIVPPFLACRKIVTTHDVLFLDHPEQFPLIYRFTRGILFKQSLRQSALRSTVSSYSRDRIAKHFGIPKDDLLILPNGVERFSPDDKTRRSAGSLITTRYGVTGFLLCVSRFEPRKNQVSLLRAYSELRLADRGIPLVFVGHPSLPSPLFTQTLDSLPETTRRMVRIIETADDNDLRNFYLAARAVIYPSLAEGFGLPPIEAGALGVPVLCSNTTAMAEFTFFGANHVDPNDYGAFRERLRVITDSPPSLQALSEISAEIRRRYDFGAAAGIFYKKLLELS